MPSHGQKAWVRVEKSGSSGPVGSAWWAWWLTTRQEAGAQIRLQRDVEVHPWRASGRVHAEQQAGEVAPHAPRLASAMTTPQGLWTLPRIRGEAGPLPRMGKCMQQA